VLAKFPDDTHILDAGTESARPNLTSLSNDNNFRHDCARYCENIAAGKHDPQWLQEAWIAHHKRKRGDFNQFMVQKFRRDWGLQLAAEENPPYRRKAEGGPGFTSAEGVKNLKGDKDPENGEDVKMESTP
jgi:hypothetical protein